MAAKGFSPFTPKAPGLKPKSYQVKGLHESYPDPTSVGYRL